MNVSTFAITCFVTHNLFTTAIVCGKESFCSERLVTSPIINIIINIHPVFLSNLSPIIALACKSVTIVSSALDRSDRGRHEICPKFYTARVWGQNFYTVNFTSFQQRKIFTLLAKILNCRRQWREGQISPLDDGVWRFTQPLQKSHNLSLP